MTANQTETNIMRDAFRLLNEYADPPKIGAQDERPWWDSMNDAMNDLGQKYNQHPLAVDMGVTIHEYLEKKRRGWTA